MDLVTKGYFYLVYKHSRLISLLQAKIVENFTSKMNDQ